MQIIEVTNFLENLAPLPLQENYDNAGLITGNVHWECTGIITSLDVTEGVVLEAVTKKCNLIVAHHPIIFNGLKKITGKNYVEKTIIAAIKNDIAIYAIHTNLDNTIEGVNGKIAEVLGLINKQILLPKTGVLKKLITFVPLANANQVRQAIFNAGGGHISNYSECSFNTQGLGTFNAGEGTNPYLGTIGKTHTEPEIKIEVIFNSWLQNDIVKSMKEAHPYEEVAYDIILLDNANQQIGAGLIAELPVAISEQAFLTLLKKKFELSVIKHSTLNGKMIKKIAICGGAGSFLINAAIYAGADFYVTSDIKYHEFFDANDKIVMADIGHYESEQFTIGLLCDVLQKKFPTFAVLKTEVQTNAVKYFI